MKALANSSPCALLLAAATDTVYHAGRSGAAEDVVCAPAATAQSWHFSRASASVESKSNDDGRDPAREASVPHSWHDFVCGAHSESGERLLKKRCDEKTKKP